jgi:rod shape-determining protein MreC
MLKRPRLIALTILILLVLVLVSLPSRTAAQLKLAVGGLFLPLFGLTSSLRQAGGKAADTVVPRKVLLTQIDQLQRENQSLRFRAQQADEILRENDRLRQYLGLQKQMPWKTKLVRVIGRDPANWWRSVLIDAGSQDGLRPNLPVVTNEGLIGRLGVVGLGQSQVLLVGDPGCLVPALIQDGNLRDYGMLAPGDSLDPRILNLTHLSRNSALKPGQKVVTSGLGGLSPPGIAIGEVVDSRPAEYGLSTEARVKLAVNLNRLEEVWVLLLP